MKKWIQKSIMVGVALVTFGFIPPSHEIWDNLIDERNPKEIAGTAHAESFTAPVQVAEPEGIPFVDLAKNAAREQAHEKFGSRIGPVITDEFDTVILPKIEEAIDMTLARLGGESVKSLAITEQPSGGHAEKIFHIYDVENNKDLVRFHVRTDKRPLDGYFFNFHYHTSEDDFSRHIVLGDIFWSKNTPPKWLS